jgi:DNA adenine methylase
MTPLYMWAGGKSKLIKHYEKIWPNFTPANQYVEPFFGGGAVFCWLSNAHGQLPAVIGDVNEDLMEIVETIKKNPHSFIAGVSSFVDEYLKISGKANRKIWYYEKREEYWESPTPEKLYLLMRLGFNGIWQTCVASDGKFGTPAGLLNQTKESQIIDKELVELWSRNLQKTQIHSGSYETIGDLKPQSFIYLDPPYRDSFTTYGTGFSDKEQRKLVNWFRSRHEEGHKVLLANRCVKGDMFFEDLVSDIADFYYFDVTYTAGRRKKTDEGFKAKPAREFLAITK